MQAESLEVLEKASVAPAQARAFVRAIEIEIAGATDTLATKHDLLRLETALRGDMNKLESGLHGEIGKLESALRVEMAQFAATLRTEMAQQMGGLRAELHRGVGSIKREMYTAILGQMAVLLGFAYFFATHLR
jgi:hypothetical protein